MQKIILRKVRFSPYEVGLNKTSENFENSKKSENSEKWNFEVFPNFPMLSSIHMSWISPQVNPCKVKLMRGEI